MNKELVQFAEFICNLLGYDKFLPANGGAEACETAVKVARRWGYAVKGVEHDKASVIMAKRNFWGRSITGSGACDDPPRYKDFGPFTPGFPLVDYDDVQAIEAQIMSDPNTVAVFLEPVQGEGGIHVPQPGYLKKVKDICEKHNVLLVCDEVQTGFGRTGKLMASDHYFEGTGTKPDILVLAKSISGGFMPSSGIVCDDHIMRNMKIGDHGSTFGGNPLAMAVSKRAVEVLLEEKMVENSAAMGAHLMSKLEAIQSPLIKNVRGRGLFNALEFHEGLEVTIQDFAWQLFKNGLLVKDVKGNAVKLTPCLNIGKKEIEDAAEIIEKSVKELEVVNEQKTK